MAHHKSCVKRIKTSEKARIKNKQYKSRMKTAIKRVNSAVNVEDAQGAFKIASSIIDKMVNKGIIHKNNGAVKKSRLAKHIGNMATSQ